MTDVPDEEPAPVRAARPVLASDSPPKTPAARLGVAVVHDLVTVVVTGEVAPGESLPPEGVLSQHFGVSRTVIRESVKRLEEKGLLTVAQGRGTQVRPRSSWNLLDPVVLSVLVENDRELGVLDEIATVRAALEGTMSAEMASRRTEEDLERLRAAFEEMRATIDDVDAYAQSDADFHFLVMELSGNRLSENITHVLFTRARESSRFAGRPDQSAFDLTLEEHRHVLEAIEAGDAARAEEAMRAHITKAWKRRRLPTTKG
ncbi:FadR/GntR family transcriptional regulator [Cnuibacter sp. UC19_7]|uniref:FadR/GntR family transcriptional regulator n=1 Tax=Cnuibacter sp. UC19_7 TaxID=3350166 RepID=UPI003672AA4E